MYLKNYFTPILGLFICLMACTKPDSSDIQEEGPAMIQGDPSLNEAPNLTTKDGKDVLKSGKILVAPKFFNESKLYEETQIKWVESMRWQRSYGNSGYLILDVVEHDNTKSVIAIPNNYQGVLDYHTPAEHFPKIHASASYGNIFHKVQSVPACCSCSHKCNPMGSCTSCMFSFQYPGNQDQGCITGCMCNRGSNNGSGWCNHDMHLEQEQ